jgi:hypothetical protein
MMVGWGPKFELMSSHCQLYGNSQYLMVTNRLICLSRAFGVYTSAIAKTPFRVQVLRAHEDAIVASANRLLAEKGFGVTTVDEVTADVRIAKVTTVRSWT